MKAKSRVRRVAARVRVADHRAAAIINLALLAGGRRDDHARLDGSTPTQAPHEAADTRIAGRKTVVADQVLVDGDGVAPLGQGGLDALAERLAGAGRRRPARWNGVGRYRPRGGRVCCGRVGGHLPGNGRFCRLCRRPPWAADRQPRRLQIGADRLAAAPGRLFDAPERPSQAPKRQDLLSLLVAQDVAHPGEGPCRPCRRQRLSRGPLMAGFGCRPRTRVLEASPFHGEGYRKAWAKLRVERIRTSQERVRRLMREHGLQAPYRAGHAHGPKAHDGTITTAAPNVMWGTDMTSTVTVGEGAACVFVAVDHCTAECIGLHAAKRGTRFEALEPIRQGVRERFGPIGDGVAEGLRLRHDHGSNDLADDFQQEVAFFGIESSPSFVREPEGNGVAERFIRT